MSEAAERDGRFEVTINMLAQCCAVLAATLLCSCKKPDMAAFEKNELVAAALAAVQHRMCYGTYPRRLEAARDFHRELKLVDVWGTPVRYTTDGSHFTITSAGPDLTFGTSDDMSIDSETVDESIGGSPSEDAPENAELSETQGSPQAGIADGDTDMTDER
jgi:hypothetical protein